jgi:putative membrane protein
VSDPEPRDLQHLHVLTPWLQSWQYLLAGLGALFAVFRDNLGEVDDLVAYVADQPLQLIVVFGLLGLVLVGGTVGGWSYLTWRMTGYAVEGGTLFLRRGVVVRQRRQVRLDRLQGVDVQEPLLGRLFGLASLKLELAAGGEATTTLGFLTLAEAHDLRVDLLERSARTSRAAHPGAPSGAPVERTLLEVPTQRVLAARLLEASVPLAAVFAYVLAVVAVAAITVGSPAGAAGAFGALLPVVPALIAIGMRTVGQFLREANFRLAESSDGLRIHSGLVSLNHRTVPQHRIQGVHINVPLMWRLTGWARLTVDVAGSTGRRADDWQPAVNTLVPVASDRDVAALFTRTSGVRLERVAFVPPRRRTRWLDPLSAGWLAVGLTDVAAVTRTGWATRRISVVPYARIQSVRVVQGPVQRWFGLASVYIDGAVGAAGWVAPHRDLADARHLVRLLSERALAARAAEA